MPHQAARLALVSTLLSACTAGVGLSGRGGVRVAGPPPAASATVRGEVRIDFFGVPLDGAQDVVFVLDRSGSMSGVAAGVAGEAVGMSKTEAVLVGLGGALANSAAGTPLPTKLEAAQRELVETLHAMPDGTRVNVIFFDDDVALLSRSMIVLDARSRADLSAFVGGIRPGGSTAAVPALELAYAMGARRVILLSDGLANTGGGGDELLARARAQIGFGVRFDTIGIGLDQDLELMQTLAAESGGLALMR